MKADFSNTGKSLYEFLIVGSAIANFQRGLLFVYYLLFTTC